MPTALTTALAVQAPHGPVLEFLVLFTVVLLGPLLVERARIPGIIGLLVGGWAIGPHGLGLIGAGSTTVPELGQLGLLYLMFVAGLELDLGILRRYRKAAATFGLLTFFLPFLAGTAVGWGLGWAPAAALLLGSLVASHTLICYPQLRDAGLGSDPAVASAVGATVLTDTIALVVLAAVAGSQTGEGSLAAVLGEVAVGLVVLGVVGMVVLPRLAAFTFSRWGTDRAARFLIAVISFLLMAAVAEVFGIEGIVGAFFAGLALNRLVPNAGPSMHQIEFFGSAVFIPVFLVSVGLLLDPAVMFTGETLGVAGLICLACLGGKAAAAALTGPMLGFSRGQVAAAFALSAPQAAATLAATLVGFDIGLFGTTTVNAVLLLILVSITVSTVVASRVGATLRPAEDPDAGTAVGERVLLAAGPQGPAVGTLRVVAALAAADAGIAEVVLTHDAGEAVPTAEVIGQVEAAILRGGLDGHVRVAVDRMALDGVVHAVLESGPSVVVVDPGLLGSADLAMVAGRVGTPVVAYDAGRWCVVVPVGGADDLRHGVIDERLRGIDAGAATDRPQR